MADESWMNGEPLAVAVERLRKWGNRPGSYDGNGVWRPHPDGNVYRVLRFVPDPINAPWDQWQVDPCEGGLIWLTNVFNVREWRSVHPSMLEGRRGIEHWPFADETREERERAANMARQKIVESMGMIQ